MVEWTLSLISGVLGWSWEVILHQARQHPFAVVLAVLAFLRSFGTTVQTGWAGVLFSLGRARKVLEPGFHPLIPVVQTVRQTPIRSITLELPRQRVTSGDGLVYDVNTTIVYRVDDPILAATAIDDVRQGVLTLVPLLVHELLREQTGQAVAARQELDEELTARASQALARWGLAVEQAGMSTIAPTPTTVRLTQLPSRVAERARLFFEQANTDSALAAVLVSPGPAPRGRSAARYRRRKGCLRGERVLG